MSAVLLVRLGMEIHQIARKEYLNFRVTKKTGTLANPGFVVGLKVGFHGMDSTPGSVTPAWLGFVVAPPTFSIEFKAEAKLARLAKLMFSKIGSSVSATILLSKILVFPVISIAVIVMLFNPSFKLSDSLK